MAKQNLEATNTGCQFKEYCADHQKNWVIEKCPNKEQFLRVTCLGTEEIYYRLCTEHRDIVLEMEGIAPIKP